MSAESNGIEVIGIRPSVAFVITLLLAVLKIANYTPITGLSWFWVLSPVLIYFGIVILGIMILYFVMS